MSDSVRGEDPRVTDPGRDQTGETKGVSLELDGLTKVFEDDEEGEVVGFSFEGGERVAGMTVETDAGEVTVGGQVAALEDVEAHEISIGRESPPER